MGTKLRLVFSITILFSSFYGFSQSGYWQRRNSPIREANSILQHIDYSKAKLYALQQEELTRNLQTATTQKNGASLVYFPDENGELLSFQVVENSVMAPALAAKYPQIKSYSGVGVGNKNDRIRFSVSPEGIQSMIVHADTQKHTFMQKVSKEGSDYVVYRRDSGITKDEDFLCTTKAEVQKSIGPSALRLVEDQVLRKFRIAISASGEYTAYHGGTVGEALSAINATITRVNEVFERDLGVTLEIVANTDLAIFTDATTDPYTGNLNAQVQSTLTNVIGEANYDVGHLFHEAANGGNAGAIGSVCINNLKGSGYAASTTPEGDIFDLDFVAHEIGHQFGANHTWSFESEGTLVQAEPGSGTTIMGYAGITNVNDVASNGDDYFHYHSIFQIAAYLSGISCGEIIPRINNTPVIVPLGNFVIPKGTAFVLRGTATDPDTLDVLTYTWEQIDNGVVTQSTFGPTRASGANFRSVLPSTSSQRYFPRLSQIIQGNLTQTNPPKNSAWETVSNVEREMNFALTVRDNAIGGGQVASDIVNLQVINAAGPFLMTSQSSNVVYPAGSIQETTWDVANTNILPINAQTVDIFLSIDGGFTFPIKLAENVPNTGSYNVLMSGVATSTARIMIKASNNVFLAVNSSNFTIEEVPVVLSFNTLDYEVCQPTDLIVPFTFQTYAGFNEEVTFNATGLPAGLSVTFTPETAIDTTTAISATFSNSLGVLKGTYPITIEAVSPSFTQEVLINLTINNDTFLDVPLLFPTDGLVGASIKQNFEWEVNPLYTSYDFEIATDLAFTNIVEAATVIFGSYVSSNLNQNTTYYWRVRPKNPCGEGDFSSPFSFTTIEIDCKSLMAKDTPKTISTIGTPTIFSKISVLDDAPISDINVQLDITHSFLFDLVVNLTSPSGTTVTLISNSCGQFRDVNAIFDDEATSFVCGNNPAIQGVVKPLGSLASFNGESAIGEWVLEIMDTAPQDGGALNSFSLDICVEGGFRPDADNDGVFDDGDDLCLGTPEGTEVNLQGCPVYRLPQTNFRTAVQSESCRSSNNGSIRITAAQAMSYEVTITGTGTNVNANFTSTYSLENLSAGTYSICIVGADGTVVYEEVCSEIILSEPDSLSVVSSLSAEKSEATLELKGATLYTIEWNGVTLQTQESQITLSLKNGLNSLKVSSDLTCQGIYEENIFISNVPKLYPNPVVDSAKLVLGTTEAERLEVHIISPDGRIIKQKKYINIVGELELDFSDLPQGVYFVKVQGEAIQETYKVIKK